MTWMEQQYDESTVEQFSERFPFAYWLNGDKKLKQLGGVPYTGGWFLPADQIDHGLLNEDGVPAKGWTAGQLDFQNGNSTDGFYAQNVSIAMLAWRRRWIVNNVNGGFAWNKYDEAKAQGNPRGHIQVLGMIHGLEAVGPMFLSAKGMVGKQIYGADNSVFSGFISNVILEAAKLRGGKGKPPFRMFWMTIGPETDGKEPKFTTVGSGNETSVITLPALVGVPGKLDKAALTKRYVGNDLFAEMEALVQSPEVESWRTGWDKTALEENASPEEPEFNDEDMPF